MELVEAIKDKQELRGISSEYVENRVKEYFSKHKNIEKKYSKDKEGFLKTKDAKIVIKEIRAILRETFGAFILTNYTKMEKSVLELKEKSTIENHNKILNMHKSSKERLPYYSEVYGKIFTITGYPKKILDLACGLNPFSYPYLGCECEYLAADISPEIATLIQEYFGGLKIKGTSFVFDLLQWKKTEFAKYAKVDVCFLFKTLDSLETIHWDFSEKLIKEIPAKYIVVSFATKSLGGKKSISGQKRTWFEKILKKNKLEHEFFEVENESFYVVKK